MKEKPLGIKIIGWFNMLFPLLFSLTAYLPSSYLFKTTGDRYLDQQILNILKPRTLFIGGFLAVILIPLSLELLKLKGRIANIVFACWGIIATIGYWSIPLNGALVHGIIGRCAFIYLIWMLYYLNRSSTKKYFEK